MIRSTAGKPVHLSAAVEALALTLLLPLLFKAQHPPAVATASLTALGSVKTLPDATHRMIGVTGKIIRNIRPRRATQLTVKPKVPAKAGKG